VAEKDKVRGPVYNENLIAAVEYLMKRGITRSGEIAKRLGISPFTVRNIKAILGRRKKENGKERKEEKAMKKKKSLIETLRARRQSLKSKKSRNISRKGGR